MEIAITRQVSRTFEQCQLTHLERQPIDLTLARQQHEAYESLLVSHGMQLIQLPELPDLPDAVFVEDTALVLDELAVMARPGSAVRRGEVASIRRLLARYRQVEQINSPGTLDGGDILRIEKSLYIGLSGRTNPAGAAQLEKLVAGFGYQVIPVPVTGCLHLKSAVTQVGKGAVLINPDWIDRALFAEYEQVTVDPSEPLAANALLLEKSVVFPAGYPATQKRLEQSGLPVETVDVSEIAKAEGGVTCCSLIFRP